MKGLSSYLSHKLPGSLADLFPGSTHVRDVRLGDKDDLAVWHFARLHDFAIISKDIDFIYLSQTLGYPPKVIWLRIGNASTAAVKRILRDNAADLERVLSEDVGMVEVEYP